MTTNVLNAKIDDVEHKIPNASSLVNKRNYGDKILGTEGKYFTTSDYNKFMSDILDAKIKTKLIIKIHISYIVKNSKLGTLATKTELKQKQDKIAKLQSFDSNYFLGKICFGDDDFQNMFFYHTTFDMLELKKDKGTDYILGWNSKGVFTSKLKPLYMLYMLPECNLETRFVEDPLAVEWNNYVTKMVNT